MGCNDPGVDIKTCRRRTSPLAAAAQAAEKPRALLQLTSSPGRRQRYDTHSARPQAQASIKGVLPSLSRHEMQSTPHCTKKRRTSREPRREAKWAALQRMGRPVVSTPPIPKDMAIAASSPDAPAASLNLSCAPTGTAITPCVSRATSLSRNMCRRDRMPNRAARRTSVVAVLLSAADRVEAENDEDVDDSDAGEMADEGR